MALASGPDDRRSQLCDELWFWDAKFITRPRPNFVADRKQKNDFEFRSQQFYSPIEMNRIMFGMPQTLNHFINWLCDSSRMPKLKSNTDRGKKASKMKCQIEKWCISVQRRSAAYTRWLTHRIHTRTIYKCLNRICIWNHWCCKLRPTFFAIKNHFFSTPSHCSRSIRCFFPSFLHRICYFAKNIINCIRDCRLHCALCPIRKLRAFDPCHMTVAERMQPAVTYPVSVALEIFHA